MKLHIYHMLSDIIDLRKKHFDTNHFHFEQRHGEERNYQCPVCGKSFKTQRDASWHTKTVHTSDKK